MAKRFIRPLGVRVNWNDERSRRIEQRVMRRLQEPKPRRPFVRLSVVGFATLVVALIWWTQEPSESRVSKLAKPKIDVPAAERPKHLKTAESSPPTPKAKALQLQDGSRVTLLTSETALDIQHEMPGLTSTTLNAGRAHFQVVPNVQRRFRVVAGSVTVEVLGTVFMVNRSSKQVDVSVDEGAVAVSWHGGKVKLIAGTTRSFPLTPETSHKATKRNYGTTSRTTTASEGVEAPPPEPLTSQPPPATIAWPQEEPVSLQAPKAPQKAVDGRGQVDVHDPQGLLVAADHARRRGNLSEAATLLRRILVEHPQDEHAPTAAFTLGRVLLDAEDYIGAANAFGNTLSLSPNGPLAQDALARRAEAWARAKQWDKARQQAEEYLSRYPQGTRQALIKRILDTSER